ncbi:MAG: hypothetical protein NW220_17045 [Leptolyngbyaceae cyanobacterium bins.349]|nr:hypothetical protein [Leptolyngbyaceae cyanobacterium bins.349]
MRLRRRVNKVLRSRTNLSATEWYQTHWQPLAIPRSISDFVYTQMQTYSGLEIGRIQPSDRLEEDLHLTLICWFDWELMFCENFLNSFEIDLTTQFNPDTLDTVQDLLLFLNHQLLSVNRY